MTVTTGEWQQRAQQALASGAAEEALEHARRALEQSPDDPEVLQVAVDAALESASDDSVELAERLVQTAATGRAYRSLGLARLTEGDTGGAEVALREALRLDPGDTAATVSLGHLSRRHGDVREATQLLEKAAAADPDDVGVISNLVDLHRQAGRLRKAIVWAEHRVALTPQDPLALLDLAELSMALNEHDEAVEIFGRLQAVDDEPGRRIFPLHGMIEARIRGEQLRGALDLAVTATEVDREELTTDALAYIVAEVFGEGDRPAPTREALMTAFTAERVRYRQVLNDSGVL